MTCYDSCIGDCIIEETEYTLFSFYKIIKKYTYISNN